MSSRAENETEILLGNKQLLGIFFVLAVLLGIAFTGGYMVGHTSSEKKEPPITAVTADPAASTAPTASSRETHQIEPDAPGATPATTPAPKTPREEPAPRVPVVQEEQRPLGAPKGKTPSPVEAGQSFAGPQGGQTFLQVAAIGHTEAEAMARVLSKKGFRAHAVQKPGTDLYRVIVGPMRDNGDLSNTRDSLRNAGFRNIFVQHY